MDDRQDPAAPADTEAAPAGEGGGPQTRREFVRNAAVAGAALAIGCGGGSDDPGTGDGGSNGGASADAGDRDGGIDASSAFDGGLDAGPAPVVPPEGTPEGVDFPLGVASGDVTVGSALLWTRYDGAMELEVAVWEMSGESYARTVWSGPATPGDGGYLRQDVEGLLPGRRYRYAFFETAAGERVARSPVGRFRAPPGADVSETLMIGATSCTSNGRSMATMARAGERDDLDLFLFVGDTTHNDSATTLAQYRAKWAENVRTDGFRALRASTSLLATWDDHEFDNDWNPETFAPARLEAAVQAFFDHQPVRRDPAAPSKIWKSMRWGRTLEVFVLDCRSERLPSTRSSADPIYVSRAQMEWLKAGLAASDAVFKVIVNSVPIGDFPGAFDFPSARNDRWEGYAAQREEILRHVEETPITGVLWLSGDFHFGSMGRVARDGLGSAQLEVLAGPGAQTGNPLGSTLGAPQFDWTTLTSNYTVLELDPAEVLMRVWFIDGAGSVLQTGEYRF